jgi:hypothetical protein
MFAVGSGVFHRTHLRRQRERLRDALALVAPDGRRGGARERARGLREEEGGTEMARGV